MNFWHLQMHLPWGRDEEEVAPLQMLENQKPFIGIHEWEDKQFYDFCELEIGAIVMVRKGNQPIALCKVISDVYTDDNFTEEFLHDHFRDVKILSWGTSYPITPDDRLFSQGTFRSCNSNTRQYKFIDNWLQFIRRNERMINATNLLQTKKNLILHGAPGTGKTYTARQVAAQIMFNKSYNELTEAEQSEIGFVQFHPSYDYTDFVEGLRPVESNDGQIGFERKDGVFKAFSAKALENLTDNNKSADEKAIKPSSDNLLETFKNSLRDKKEIIVLSIRSKTKWPVFLENDTIKVRTQKGEPYSTSPEKIRRYLETKKYDGSHDSYEPAIGQYILDNYSGQNKNQELITGTTNNDIYEKHSFVFIIDEINRGDISKIFGELFFCIEPSYRGPEGKVFTQYQNLVEKGDAFETGFYIPENVYIIGTMNDIDRSVESMDFAMRRRFDFWEITAEDSATAMGIDYSDASPMKRLNDAIEEKLGIDYQIGGSYFKDYKNDLNNKDKLKELWTRNLKGLLKEYLRGQRDAKEKLEEFERAFYG